MFKSLLNTKIEVLALAIALIAILGVVAYTIINEVDIFSSDVSDLFSWGNIAKVGVGALLLAPLLFLL